MGSDLTQPDSAKERRAAKEDGRLARRDATLLATEPPQEGVRIVGNTRIDAQNRVLCMARSKASGELCKAPAVTGARVCRIHGGSSPQAQQRSKLRLQALVDPAIATLAKEMTTAEKSRDRLSAANSVLDRAGYARVARVDLADAREMLVQRLLEMQAQALGTEPGEPDDYEYLDDDLQEGQDA